MCRVIRDPAEFERVLDRFTAKTETDRETGCILWTGALKAPDLYDPTGGYGRFWFDGKSTQAHVWVMTQYLGRKITKRQEVHHTCRTRRCINPHHLIVLSKAAHRRLEWARRITQRFDDIEFDAPARQEEVA